MDIKEKLKNLPKKPGCYLMYNQNREIIYVGKAKNLLNRVKSYFTGSHDTKTTQLISNIFDFEFIITSTETEAFILEMNLIKKHMPKYNIMLTDDKSYPFICISNEKHPRIFYTRDLNKKGKCYGPYPNAVAAKQVVDLLNRIYPLRKCHVLPKKECLYYHIGQCLAPCIKDIKDEDYQDILNKINSFLKGNIKEQQKALEKQMTEAAENLNFEKAIELKKIIVDLNAISEKQKMELDVDDTDIFAYVISDIYISIQIFHIRNKKTVERSGFLFEIMGDAIEMFTNFIGQFYFVYNNPIPKEILIPNVDISSIDEKLKNKITIPKIGMKKEFVELVKENAEQKLSTLIKQEKTKYEKTLGAVINLGELLNINTPYLIEAFDNSNIQGTSSVSAMVCYQDGLPNKKKYRKYKIKSVEGANDYQTMYEVISRRYKRLKEDNGVFPDLIIVDGGKIQVASALKALKNLNLIINVLGLGKDEKHKTSYLYYNDQEVYLDKKSNLFYFLENLQDEVHRYAITFHHMIHSKNTLSSKLEQIKGIGKVKKKQILDILRKSNINDFENELHKINLSEEQIIEILKVLL